MRRNVRASAGPRPRQVVATAVVAMVSVVGLTACQDATILVAHNLCGFPIEVDANEVDPPSSHHWKTLADDERKDL